MIRNACQAPQPARLATLLNAPAARHLFPLLRDVRSQCAILTTPTTSCHKGAGRVIEGKPHFHVSVKTRMEALGYKPEAEWEGGEGAVVWVE